MKQFIQTVFVIVVATCIKLSYDFFYPLFFLLILLAWVSTLFLHLILYQKTRQNAIELNDCTPSHAQSIRLKKLSQEGLLDQNVIYEIMSEEKPNQQEQIKLKRDDLRKYFPSSYTDEQIKKDIVKGLELLKRQRDRNRDAR